MMRISIFNIGGKIILYLILLILAVIYALPLVWLIISSLKTPPQVFTYPPQWIPRPVAYQNYFEVIVRMDFLNVLKNSCIVALSVVLGATFSSSVVAYSFAKLKWPGRDILFVILLSTLMVPYAVTVIPLYLTYKSFGWLDTFKPLIMPAFFGGGAFYIFLLRQFFYTIPSSLSDAAKIDGSSEWGIFWRIFLPLSKPALGIVAILAFTGSWNDFLGPLIYLRSQTKWTLALALHAFAYEAGGYVEWGVVMAGCVLMIIPIFVLFFIFQKSFIEGIALTGVKE